MTAKKIKILQVNKRYYPHIGGVEKHVQDLAETLKDKVSMRVLAVNDRFATEAVKINGVSVVKAAGLGTVASAPLAPSLPVWLRRLQSDIFHFHFPYPLGDLAYLLARPRGKLIVTYHSDIVRQKNLLALYRPFMKRFLRRADVVLAASPNMVENSPVLREFTDKCRLFHYGIDVGRFKMNDDLRRRAAAYRRRLGGRNIVLFVGRLVYYKGVAYLLEAMKSVDGMLVLAGTGNLKPELEKQAADLGVADKVIFLGRVKDDELPALYHACDIFILPSIARTEAFGLVQLEAQACGKPVVSTDLPTGVPYANLDGVTGLVAPPRDGRALAAAVNNLLNDKELNRRLGERGRRRVESEFTLAAMGEAVLKIYQEVMEG